MLELKDSTMWIPMPMRTIRFHNPHFYTNISTRDHQGAPVASASQPSSGSDDNASRIAVPKARDVTINRRVASDRDWRSTASKDPGNVV